MSGKDNRKSAVYYQQRILTKEPNGSNIDACMMKVGSFSSGRKLLVKQLIDLGFIRLSSREFRDPSTRIVRIISR